MLKVRIDNRDFLISSQYSILEACKFVGVIIPRFCYHEKLSIAGNCRMCLVEIDKSPKPVASCATPISNAMEICTKSPFVQKAREGVLEFLLLHHPLDCPICDQAGECDLQDQYLLFGAKYGRYFFGKRAVEDKVLTPVIKTIMTRCIHCTRCIRFFSEICGVQALGTLNRGVNTEVGTYVKLAFNNELSGNVVDLCPVGALTTRFSSFRARPWELRVFESYDLTDGLGNAVVFNLIDHSVGRILPKKNREINDAWISDKVRFLYDAFLQPHFSQQLSCWFNFLPLISTFSLQNIHFILSKNLSCSILRLFKHLVYLRKNFFYVSVSSLTANFSRSNFYQHSFFLNASRLLDLDASTIGFIFSCNLRLESALLNAKVRSLILRTGIAFFSDKAFWASYSFSVVNLRISAIDIFFSFLKYKEEAVLFFNKNIFLVFIGLSLSLRVANFNFFVSLLKRMHCKFLLYLVQTVSNGTLQSYYNFASLNSHSLKKSYTFFYEVDDSAQSRFLKNSNTGNFLSLRSNLNSFNSWQAPHLLVQNAFESGGIFFNLEQRSLNVLPLSLESTGLCVSMDFFLQSFKALLSFDNSPKASSFEEALFIDYSLLSIDISNSLLPFLAINSYVSYMDSSTFFSFYPIKAQVTDFYQTDLLVKHSEQLRLCSRVARESSRF